MRRVELACFVLLLCFGSALGQQFKIHLNVTDGVTAKTLAFGIHPSATDGYDIGIDSTAPPINPGSSDYDARLRFPDPGGDPDYEVDVRNNSAVNKVYHLRYNSGTANPIVISWDTNELDNLASSFTMSDEFTGSAFTLDMKTAGSLNTSSNPFISDRLRITIVPPYTPVQLASFAGTIINQQGHVRLNWRTLTESNNYGFYVQKSPSNPNNYQTISQLVPGYGTTLEPHDYSWIDASVASGTWYYRLKQVDLDGAEHYSESIQLSRTSGVKEKPLPAEIGLSQNYPNPFNPTTKIEYALPKQGHVKLEVYNLIGQRVATLLDEVKPAGYHVVEFTPKGFSSGLYLYRMTTNDNVTLMKRMIMLK